ncbi:MAG: NAD(P)-dependent alcohol dehydrogenase [Chitinophagaceae bacterium]|nr:NAD(P)-dependent alcohol dehydrogenase [Chitinophagaceae bacterium]MCW5929353.1 NAD(P)-dependent alcohol dehydrogenase [Chitinophagaceae bacterium]
MKAYTRNRYGGPEILHLEEIEKPVVRETHLLVKVYANSLNPADWRLLRGDPFFARFFLGLFRPKYKIPGADFAGVVVETGSSVTNFKVGDKVFGETLTGGAFAEYCSIASGVCACMPEGWSFKEMACLPVAGLTALQAVVTHGKLKAGETVLVNGASGGVGHFVVQLAKALGAKVTAVCSTRNTDFVKSLGADAVIAYDRNDIHQHHEKYDLVVDTHGNLRFRDFKRMGKRGILVGFTTLKNMISVMLGKSLGRYPLTQVDAQSNIKDLETLASFVEDGKLKPGIEKTYSWTEIPDAIRIIEKLRTRGKLAIVWVDEE